MAKRRPSGDGMVRKREDGRWEGRIVIGHKANGDSIFRYIYADTQKELTAKLRQNIDIYQALFLRILPAIPLSIRRLFSGLFSIRMPPLNQAKGRVVFSSKHLKICAAASKETRRRTRYWRPCKIK